MIPAVPPPMMRICVSMVIESLLFGYASIKALFRELVVVISGDIDIMCEKLRIIIEFMFTDVALSGTMYRGIYHK